MLELCEEIGILTLLFKLSIKISRMHVEQG